MIWSDQHAKTLRAVFEALNASEIPWMVLRNFEGLPEKNTSKDIDIGVAPAQFMDAEILIAATMKIHGLDHKQTAVFEWGRCSSYFGTIDGVPLSIKIDIMDGYSWRAAGLFNFEKLAPNMRNLGEFCIPGEIDDAVILWLKPMMTGAGVKPVYAKRFEKTLKEHPDAFRKELDRLFDPELANWAWRHLEAGNYQEILSKRKKLAWNAWWREVRKKPVKSALTAAKYIGLELVRRSSRPKGTFIAVLGPDGVGKTTFISTFQSSLAQLQSKDLNGVELRHFRPRIFPNINALISRTPEAPAGEASVPHQAEPAGKISSLMRVTYYWLDYVWGYWAAMRKDCVAGRTVIYDRYIYDFIVDPRRSRFGLPRWIIECFVALTPKPDLVIFLDADPEIIYARKQELTLEEIARQLGEYRTLHDKNPERFMRLNAALPPQENADLALSTLINRLYKAT